MCKVIFSRSLVTSVLAKDLILFESEIKSFLFFVSEKSVTWCHFIQ